MTSDSRASRSNALLQTVPGALALGILWFVGRKPHYLADYIPASYTDYFWPRRFGRLAHLAGGALAIGTGLVQLWPGLTHRIGALHRLLGRVYRAGILVGCIGGFYLSFSIPGHLAYSAGLFMLCVDWVLTTAMALYAVRTGRFEQHREWMLRSYTATFAFVTFRLGTAWLSPWVHVPDDPVASELDTLLAWACWAIPLLIAEPLIELRAMHRAARARGR